MDSLHSSKLTSKKAFYCNLPFFIIILPPSCFLSMYGFKSTEKIDGIFFSLWLQL